MSRRGTGSTAAALGHARRCSATSALVVAVALDVVIVVGSLAGEDVLVPFDVVRVAGRVVAHRHVLVAFYLSCAFVGLDAQLLVVHGFLLVALTDFQLSMCRAGR